MFRNKLAALSVAVLALFVVPTAALSQGTPAGNKPLRLTVGPPKRDGVVIVEIRVRKDKGRFTTSPSNVPINSKHVKIQATVNINAGDSASVKAGKIRNSIHLARNQALRSAEWGFDVAIGEGLFENGVGLIFNNREGFRVMNVRVKKDSTGEKHDVDHFKPEDQTSMTTLQGMGLLASYDLTGTPSGGLMQVEVNGTLLFSLNTGSYESAQQLEFDMAMIMSEFSQISQLLAFPSSELLCDEAEDIENPFDGLCTVLMPTGSASSYSIHTDDPGLDVREEFFLNDRVDSIGTTYCEATLNSTGQAAEIWARGSTDVADNYLVLHAENVPNQFGIFFAGPNQIQVPFGEGNRCVGGGVIRINSPQMAEDNRASDVVDLAHFPLELVGTTPNFQYWCRDPQGGGTKFNLSNAITVALN